MKKLFLSFTLVTLVGCIGNFNQAEILDCPETPNNPLDQKNIIDISPLNHEPQTRKRLINYGSDIGYKFTGQLGQQIDFQTNDAICIWIYTPANQILNEPELPLDGEYIIQISVPKGSTTFALQISLDQKNNNPNSIQTSPAAIESGNQSPKEPNYENFKKILKPAVNFVKWLLFTDWRQDISIGLTTSSIVAFLLHKNLKTIIEEQNHKKSIKNLEYFWRHSNVSRVRQKYHIVFGMERGETSSQWDHWVKYHHALAVFEIDKILHKVYADNVEIHLHYLNKDAAIDPNYFEDHVILIGGKTSCNCFANFYDLSKNLNYNYEKIKEEQNEIIINFHGGDHKASYKDNNLVESWGTIVRIINDQKLIIHFDGIYGAGIFSAVLLTTNVDAFPNHQFSQNQRLQQLLVKVNHPIGYDTSSPTPNTQPSTHVYWRSDNFDSATLKSVIQSVGNIENQQSSKSANVLESENVKTQGDDSSPSSTIVSQNKSETKYNVVQIIKKWIKWRP